MLAPDLFGALERQELLFKAEKVGIEELYEARLRIMQVSDICKWPLKSHSQISENLDHTFYELDYELDLITIR